MVFKRDVLAATLGALLAIPALALPAAAASSCGPIRNPYAGTWYESVDITRIRAQGVSCATARRVAAGAHAAVIRTTPPTSGVQHYRWHGWAVTGDIRGAWDHYVARKGDSVVRWRF